MGKKEEEGTAGGGRKDGQIVVTYLLHIFSKVCVFVNYTLMNITCAHVDSFCSGLY